MAPNDWLTGDLPMEAHPGDLCFEFKPKWLAPCPSAPADASRCRTCARKACKDRKGAETERFCPLDLVHCQTDADPQAAAVHVADSLNADLGLGIDTADPRLARFADWLCRTDLFTRLRDEQLRRDPRGPLLATADDDDFALAMTLRDCACFVRVPVEAERPVEARLADLDKKNARAKLEQWRDMEKKFIDEKWYYSEAGHGRRTNCRLERVL